MSRLVRFVAATGCGVALGVVIGNAVVLPALRGDRTPAPAASPTPSPTPDEVAIPVFERTTPPPNTPPGQGNWKYSWAYVKGHWCQVPTDGVTWDNVVGRQQCPHS